ncbi:MAG: ferredoxin-type protein NapF [Candidatus Competibacteraceae bacterium]|nr:ferredoxin-type protein NapF [Candidatus Competibacteraceae bacterium]
MTQTIDHGRRALLRGRLREAHAPLRPPWARPERDFAAACSHCGDCIRDCPENILTPDRDGLPRVDFSRGECSFCQACVQVCPEPAFDPAGRPWEQSARIGNGCLARQGIYCESCRDPCETRAIRFRPARGGIPTPTVAPDDCSGCGACVAVCPAGAIQVLPSP